MGGCGPQAIFIIGVTPGQCVWVKVDTPRGHPYGEHKAQGAAGQPGQKGVWVWWCALGRGGGEGGGKDGGSTVPQDLGAGEKNVCRTAAPTVLQHESVVKCHQGTCWDASQHRSLRVTDDYVNRSQIVDGIVAAEGGRCIPAIVGVEERFHKMAAMLELHVCVGTWIVQVSCTAEVLVQLCCLLPGPRIGICIS
jgi:hypothetical protein